MEETGYENPVLLLKATAEEQEHLEQLREARDRTRQRLQEAKDRYGLNDTDLVDMKDQYENDSASGSLERDSITGDFWYA